MFLLSVFVAKAQEEIASSIISNSNYGDYMNLESLSDEELEAICTERGFELVKEKNADGDEISYTHEDYMDAASQCLAIEAEMEKVLKEHPEILDELKEEAEKIRAEKDKLEAELALARENATKQHEEDRKAFVGGINNGAAAAVVDNDENGKENSATKEKDKVFGDADAGGVVADNNAVNAEINSTAKAEEVEEETKESATAANEAEGEDDMKVTQDEIVDANDEQQQDSGEVLDLDKEQESEESTTNTTTDLPSDEEYEIIDNNHTIPKSLSDLTKETFIEMKVQMQRDLKMLVDIIFPKHLRGPVKTALQPVLRITKEAGNSVLDMLKRYLVAILDKKENGQQVDTVN